MNELVTTEMTIIRGGNEIDVTIDGYVEYFTDTSFGEDADGNRGIKTIKIEEVRDVSAFYDNNGDPIVVMDVELTKEEKEQAERLLAEKFLEAR